ncbi:MAG TPA: metal ABC transporter permease [Rhodopila sp.]|nr:metal ABC transporter permease [Rhodopila sp.]
MLAALTDPFALGFMRRALAGCLALSVAAPPLGVFLVLRRMSLMSDVLQHGVLPGLALGAILAGLSVWAMGLGGLIAALAVAVLAGWLARRTGGREDSQLAGMYLIALAAGVALISTQRSVDLTHILFGNVLAVDRQALLGMAGVATLTLPTMALIWRPLVLECLDPGFTAATTPLGALWHLLFLALVALCVVSGFVALGTLMSVGLMMLPAIAARHWSDSLAGHVRVAVLIACASSIGGLVLSFHADIPAGPAVVLTAGAFWVLGLLAGRRASLWRQAISLS